MKKITFIGSASCGKTTLANGIFNSIKKKSINAEIVHEFVRFSIHSVGPMESIWEQYRIRTHQKDLEDSVPKSVDLLISDSGTLSPFFYANHYMDKDRPRDRLVMQDLYKYITDDIYLGRYDLIFYIPVIQGVDPNDGTRFQTNDDILAIDAHMDMFFNQLHKTDAVHCVNVPLEERHDFVMKIILNNIASDGLKTA